MTLPNVVTKCRAIDFSRGNLKVSANKRFLVHADGTPFFYLADTAWELFHRLTLNDSRRYLENRAAKGYTVIQAVALGELDGVEGASAMGRCPLIDNDPLRPDLDPAGNGYWDHVDAVVRMAGELGLYIGLLPTWGDKVCKLGGGKGPQILTSENAAAYGAWIGERYCDYPNIIWINGGDRPLVHEGIDYRPVWRALAQGIRSSDSNHLMTFHPVGCNYSSQYLHNDDWLDFNTTQSGHSFRYHANYDMILHDRALEPVKPCLDSEPRYEDHPVGWWPEMHGWFDQHDVRLAAYWALFAGACGHTYGCHGVWQMYAPGRDTIGYARTYWYDSLDLAGAGQMQHARALIESRDFLSRVPDQWLISAGQAADADHIQACRGKGYIFVYVPTGKPVKVDPCVLETKSVVCWWYNVRTGEAVNSGECDGMGVQEFVPPGNPGRGNDWVLVLDNPAYGYVAPGQQVYLKDNGAKQ